MRSSCVRNGLAAQHAIGLAPLRDGRGGESTKFPTGIAPHIGRERAPRLVLLRRAQPRLVAPCRSGKGRTDPTKGEEHTNEMHHEHRKAVLLALANQMLIPRPNTAPESSEMEGRALRSTRSAKASDPQAVHDAGTAPAQWHSRRDQGRAELLMQLHARLGITQQPDDGDVVLSSDDESEIGAPPQEEEKEEEEEALVLVEHSEHARAHEKGTVPSPKGAPAKRVHHSRHMLSQALADAVANRGAYPLGAHVRDALAPTVVASSRGPPRSLGRRCRRWRWLPSTPPGPSCGRRTRRRWDACGRSRTRWGGRWRRRRSSTRRFCPTRRASMD